MKLLEFINVMENYSYFSMGNKFSHIEVEEFLHLLNKYSEYLLQYDSSASMRSLSSSIKVLINNFDKDFDITHTEHAYRALKSEHLEISRSVNVKSFKEFIIPTVRDLKLSQLID